MNRYSAESERSVIKVWCFSRVLIMLMLSTQNFDHLRNDMFHQFVLLWGRCFLLSIHVKKLSFVGKIKSSQFLKFLFDIFLTLKLF